MSNLYVVKTLTRRHGNRTTLAVDELSIQAGRIYTLTGPNGAGKSTLLQILAFLQPPSGGEVFYRGERVTWSNAGLRRLRREVTLLHQAPYLFASTVFSNVAFGLKARGVAGTELRDRVSQALELVGLAGFEGRKARELSGGEAQRVAMARALALRPAVLLLDEPLANVDRESAAILDRLIPTLPEAGTTVILTTHDPEHPDRLGGETIHLVAGRITEDSAPFPPHHPTKRTERCPHLPKPEKSFSTASLPSA